MATASDRVRTMAAYPERVDLKLIAGFVEPGARVLDVGCADGALLKILRAEKAVDGCGIEISQRRVNECVAQGLSVVQGDADHDLDMYPEGAFDYAILSQTIQATHNPRDVLLSLLRIGRRVIVSIPNFGHWRIRLQLASAGRMPVTSNLPYNWYDTPNIHFCTIRDFVALVKEMEARIETAVALYGRKGRLNGSLPLWVWNLFGEQAVFVLSRR